MVTEGKMATEEKIEYTFGDFPGYPAFPARGHWGSSDDINTQHLPAEVVSQEFTLVVVSRTSREDARIGASNIALRFRDQDNPKDLSADEVEYIRALVGNWLDGFSLKTKHGG